MDDFQNQNTQVMEVTFKTTNCLFLLECIHQGCKYVLTLGWPDAIEEWGCCVFNRCVDIQKVFLLLQIKNALLHRTIKGPVALSTFASDHLTQTNLEGDAFPGSIPIVKALTIQFLCPAAVKGTGAESHPGIT